MKITIKGSVKELSELTKVLVGAENKEKNADLPPLLTELVEKKAPSFEKLVQQNKATIETLRKNFADKENAPQAETAEQDIPFIHFKPRFEEWIRIVREANEGE